MNTLPYYTTILSSRTMSLAAITLVALLFAPGVRPNGICHGRIILTVDELRSLAQENCSVIDGPLRFLAMKSCPDTSATPPRLDAIREVTHYVEIVALPSIYRSLSQLLPNLTRIRGKALVCSTCGRDNGGGDDGGYAMSIHSSPFLRSLGLTKLRRIDRGGVRLLNNHQLVSTVNWTWIVANEKANLNVEENLSIRENRCDNDTCPSGYCWDTSTSDCQERNSCLNSSYSDGLCTSNVSCQGTCLTKCSDGEIVSADGLRCVERCDEIAAIVPSVDLRVETVSSYQMNGSCVVRCPPGYYGDQETRHCIESEWLPCPQKVMIGSEADARDFANCEYVNGSLIISVDLSREQLMTYFGRIRAVEDYVMIFQTMHVTSLDFLNNVAAIRGRNLWKDKYSFVLYANAELGQLWNGFRNLSIADNSSAAYVHINPNLCHSAMDDVRFVYGGNVTGTGNSLKGLCKESLVPLKLEFSDVTASQFRVAWNSSSRSRVAMLYDVMGYSIFYRKQSSSEERAPVGEIFMDRDSSWFIIRVDPEEKSATIRQLEPSTKYEVLVESVTLASIEKNVQMGEESPVRIVTTRPAVRRLAWHIESTMCSPRSASLAFFDRNEDKARDFDVYIQEIEWPNDVSEWIQQRRLHNDPDIRGSVTCDSWQDSHKEECWIHSDQLASVNRTVIVTYGAEVLSLVDDVSCDCSVNGSIEVSLGTTSRSYSNPQVNVTVHEAFTLTEDSYVKLDLATFRKPFALYSVQVRRRKRRDGVTECSSWSLPTVFRTPPDCDKDEVMFNSIQQENSRITVSWIAPKTPNGRVLFYVVELYAMKDEISKIDVIEETECPYNNSLCQNDTGKRKCADETQCTVLLVCRVDPQPEPSVDFRITFTGKREDFQLFARVYTKSLADYGECHTMWAHKRHTKNLKDSTYTASVEKTIGLSVGLSLAGLVLLSVVLLLIKTREKWRKNKVIIDTVREYFNDWNIDMNFLPHSPGAEYEADEWEIDQSDVIMTDPLGEGTFGIVYRGVLVKEGSSVAVKCISESSDAVEKLNFLREASIMKKFINDYVVRLLGIVSRGNSPLVIMELMENGDLKKYLRSKRPRESTTSSGDVGFIDDFPLSVNAFLKMSAEIATGMAYLASKNFVHRDLAARNCMVNDSGTVKIGDFGMTRDIYQNDYYRKQGKGPLPVRWMAPESLHDGVFTSASDVWSYGIVLWEISTLGALPYCGLSNEEVMSHVCKGKLMDVAKLQHVPKIILSLTKKCWEYRTLDRPSFPDILNELPALEGCEATI